MLLKKRDENGNVLEDVFLAHSFKSILPLQDIGGDGQSSLVSNYTINSRSDVLRGFVDASEEANLYDSSTDTYDKDVFVFDEQSKLSTEYVASVEQDI